MRSGRRWLQDCWEVKERSHFAAIYERSWLCKGASLNNSLQLLLRRMIDVRLIIWTDRPLGESELTLKLARRLERFDGIDQSRLPIYSQDWWINIARGSSKHCEATVVHGDVVVGRLHYALARNRLGLVRGHDPHWSHLGGPIVDDRLSRAEQAEVIGSLLNQLPPWASFEFVCDPNLSYADLVRSAFGRLGFDCATQVTYLRLPSEGEVLNARKNRHKGHIRRAAKQLDCVDICGEDFVKFFEANLKAKRISSNSPLQTMSSLIDGAVARGQGRAIAAKPKSRCQSIDDSGSYDAAIVYVWDNSRCYYWLSTRRIPSANNSNSQPHPDATKLLAVEAMVDAQAKNLVFDSDGVTGAGTENLHRNIFGLRTVESRNVFRRATKIERLYQKYRQHFNSLIPCFSGVAAVVGDYAAQLVSS